MACFRPLYERGQLQRREGGGYQAEVRRDVQERDNTVSNVPITRMRRKPEGYQRSADG